MFIYLKDKYKVILIIIIKNLNIINFKNKLKNTF